MVETTVQHFFLECKSQTIEAIAIRKIEKFKLNNNLMLKFEMHYIFKNRAPIIRINLKSGKLNY